MGDPNRPEDEGAKREILRPGDSLLDVSSNKDDRAEAAARAARKAIEDRERAQKSEAARKLGWYGRLWKRISTWAKALGAILANPFRRYFPRTTEIVTRTFTTVFRSHDPVTGQGRWSLSGKVLITALALLAAWPVFKMYYVLGTTRDFHEVDITFKQIISHERYLVFGNYKHDDGTIDEMAFNVTDSWVYWNWTPDLTFAQIPMVGKCDLHTYGWYLRVPKFIPFAGRTLLVEPVIISARCTGFDGHPTGSG